MRVRNIQLSYPWKQMNIDVYVNNSDEKEYVALITMTKLIAKEHRLKYYVLDRSVVFPDTVWIGPANTKYLISIAELPEILQEQYNWTDTEIADGMKFFEIEEIPIPIPIEDAVERHARRIAEEMRAEIFKDPELNAKYEKELREHIFSDTERIKRYEAEAEIQIRSNIMKRLRTE